MTLDINRDTDDMKTCSSAVADFAVQLESDARALVKACDDSAPLMQDEAAQKALGVLKSMAANLMDQASLAMALAGRIERSAKILEDTEDL